MCLFKVWALVNLLPHLEHLWGFSPVWVIMCVYKVPAHANSFHTENTMCALSCVLKFLGSLNLFFHTVHLWGFSPVWVIICVFRELFITLRTFVRFFPCVDHNVSLIVLGRLNHFLTTEHWWGFSLMALMCALKLHASVNCLPHSEHVWGIMYPSETSNGIHNVCQPDLWHLRDRSTCQRIKHS